VKARRTAKATRKIERKMYSCLRNVIAPYIILKLKLAERTYIFDKLRDSLHFLKKLVRVRLTGRCIDIVRVDETLFLSISALSSKMRMIFHVNSVNLSG
jgi:predicted RNase H-like nuclease (RuvC/YqgF family)